MKYQEIIDLLTERVKKKDIVLREARDKTVSFLNDEYDFDIDKDITIRELLNWIMANFSTAHRPDDPFATFNIVQRELAILTDDVIIRLVQDEIIRIFIDEQAVLSDTFEYRPYPVFENKINAFDSLQRLSKELELEHNALIQMEQIFKLGFPIEHIEGHVAGVTDLLILKDETTKLYFDDYIKMLHDIDMGFRTSTGNIAGMGQSLELKDETDDLKISRVINMAEEIEIRLAAIITIICDSYINGSDEVLINPINAIGNNVGVNQLLTLSDKTDNFQLGHVITGFDTLNVKGIYQTPVRELIKVIDSMEFKDETMNIYCDNIIKLFHDIGFGEPSPIGTDIGASTSARIITESDDFRIKELVDAIQEVEVIVDAMAIRINEIAEGSDTVNFGDLALTIGTANMGQSVIILTDVDNMAMGNASSMEQEVEIMFIHRIKVLCDNYIGASDFLIIDPTNRINNKIGLVDLLQVLDKTDDLELNNTSMAIETVEVLGGYPVPFKQLIKVIDSMEFKDETMNIYCDNIINVLDNIDMGSAEERYHIISAMQSLKVCDDMDSFKIGHIHKVNDCLIICGETMNPYCENNMAVSDDAEILLESREG